MPLSSSPSGTYFEQWFDNFEQNTSASSSLSLLLREWSGRRCRCRPRGCIVRVGCVVVVVEFTAVCEQQVFVPIQLKVSHFLKHRRCRYSLPMMNLSSDRFPLGILLHDTVEQRRQQDEKEQDAQNSEQRQKSKFMDDNTNHDGSNHHQNTKEHQNRVHHRSHRLVGSVMSAIIICSDPICLVIAVTCKPEKLARTENKISCSVLGSRLGNV